MFRDFSFGAVGEIRTLVPVLPATRFPVVLVMTTSIPLRIAMLNSESYYIRNPHEVKSYFAKNARQFFAS